VEFTLLQPTVQKKMKEICKEDKRTRTLGLGRRTVPDPEAYRCINSNVKGEEKRARMPLNGVVRCKLLRGHPANFG
jgi:hypothetical protein